MAIGEIHKGDIGTAFRATLKDQNNDVQDVSTATTLKLKFRKPNNGDVIEKTAALYTDGTDGVIQYVTISADDLDETGIWSIQAYVIIGGATHHSDVDTFRVEPNLD